MANRRYCIGDYVKWAVQRPSCSGTGLVIGNYTTLDGSHQYLVESNNTPFISISAQVRKLFGVKPEHQNYSCVQILEHEILGLVAGSSPPPTLRAIEKILACADCGDFAPYAEKNMGDKFVCYSCRSSNGWKYR